MSFQSGYLRKEHKESKINPKELLFDGIKELIGYIGNRNITIVIEPEPGMFIETVKDGVDIINAISSEKFKLHLDIGHTFCTEDDFLGAINDNINHVKYMHVADILSGHAVRFVQIESLDDIKYIEDKDSSYIFMIKDNFIYYSDNSMWIFCDDIDFVSSLKDITFKKHIITSYNMKYSCEISDSLEAEIKSYTDSVPSIALEDLDRVGKVLTYLRHGENPIITKTICNTVNGKVHYHERLGLGEIPLKDCLKLIKELNFDGFITVELYNHTNMWEKTLPESFAFIEKIFTNYTESSKKIIDEWGENTMGDAIDHRTLTPPYIRLISLRETTAEEWIFTFDLRFVRPSNNEAIDPTVLHSLEHLLIKYFKQYLPENYVLLAPMGCRTGFYLVLYGKVTKRKVLDCYEKILQSISYECFVPYQTLIQCGNYGDHDLDGAIKVISSIIRCFDEVDHVL